MLNIKLLLAYDGNGYLGWQKTRMGPSIEDVLQQTLEKVLQEKISLQAASRTDAGVHAHGQVVNFFTAKEKIIPEKLQISLNSLLPKDITIRSVQIVDENFHPTLHNCGKEYHYYICSGPIQLPQHRYYSWHCHYELNLPDMLCAGQHLIGRYDFAALCNFKKNASYENTIRTITSIEIIELPPAAALPEKLEKRLLIKIVGDSFLYKMVRNMVGCLVQVGRGIIPVDHIIKIIESKDRTQAGVTAPSHGLALHRVFY